MLRSWSSVCPKTYLPIRMCFSSLLSNKGPHYHRMFSPLRHSSVANTVTLDCSKIPISRLHVCSGLSYEQHRYQYCIWIFHIKHHVSIFWPYLLQIATVDDHVFLFSSFEKSNATESSLPSKIQILWIVLKTLVGAVMSVVRPSNTKNTRPYRFWTTYISLSRNMSSQFLCLRLRWL
jgi:hypothetical protein